jgi:hypothetical protein
MNDQTMLTRAPGRRGLLRGVGIGAAALGALSLGFEHNAEAQAAITDEDILNFALNLEYLEAEYYSRGVNGVGLPANVLTGTGTQGSVTGGSAVSFTNLLVKELFAEIANDEYNHVLFLRTGLGSAAVAEPSINLSTSFSVLAQAAGLGANFNPFANQDSFLIGAYIFEDVGVTAYHGAAPYLKSKAYLLDAAGILAVEAYHAAEIRLQLLQNGIVGPPRAISALRAKLSGANDDQGVYMNSSANIVPTNPQGLAYERNTNQVLNVVYGGGAASDYLFFPNKMNGTIQ